MEWLLFALVVVPILIALIVARAPSDHAAARLTLFAALAELGLSAIAAAEVVYDGALTHEGEQFLGWSWHLDGLALMFVPLSAIATLLVVVQKERESRSYYATVLGLEAATMAMFCSLDLGVIWLAFVAQGLLGYALLRLPGEQGADAERRDAARHFLQIVAISAALLLGAVAWLGARTSADLGALRLDLPNLVVLQLDDDTQRILFAVMICALGLRVPIFPFHGWLPKVLAHSPTVVTAVFLLGIKSCAFVMLRFVWPICAGAAEAHWTFLAWLGAIGTIYAGLVALVQEDVRLWLGYSAVSQMGIILLAMSAHNDDAIGGALLQLGSHGLSTAGLAFLSASISTRTKTMLLTRMPALARAMPKLSVMFLLIALGSLSMPGTSGFNGEHLILLGALERHWMVAAAAGLGSLMTAAYLIIYYQRAFFVAGESAGRTFSDLDRKEWLVCGTIVTIVFALGLLSSPLLSAMHHAVRGAFSGVAMLAPSPDVSVTKGAPR